MLYSGLTGYHLGVNQDQLGGHDAGGIKVGEKETGNPRREISMIIDGVVLEEENMNQREKRVEKEKRGKEEKRKQELKDKKKRVASLLRSTINMKDDNFTHIRRQIMIQYTSTGNSKHTTP